VSLRNQGASSGSAAAQAAFLVVLTGAALAVALWVDHTIGESRLDGALAAGFAIAFVAGRLLTLRLPQGDDVYITLMVGLCGIAVLDVGTVMAASVAAGLLDSVARFSQSSRTVSVARMLDAVRGSAVIGLMAPWQLVLHPLMQDGQPGDALIWWVLLAGVCYAAADLLSVGIQQQISGGAPAFRGAGMLLRSLGFVYLVHLAMAAVVVRLYSIPGVWAFPIALLLTLILQNSFNLYLRIRRAYTETIGALAHAAELDRPHDSGHARRVADLSIAVGRRMGLSSRDLEQIGYAALLHDIGRIGYSDETPNTVYARRGAEIVSSIPFLAGVAPLIDPEDLSQPEERPIGADVVRTCSRYDRLRAEVGALAALETLGADHRSVNSRVLETLDDIIRGQFSKVGLRS
jgi:hypothetical protein